MSSRTSGGFWALGPLKPSRKDVRKVREEWGSELLDTGKGLMLQRQTVRKGGLQPKVPTKT